MAQKTESGEMLPLAVLVSEKTGLRPCSPALAAKLEAMGRPLPVPITKDPQWDKFMARFFERVI